MSRLRSNLSKARGLGSAKSGTAHFIAERVSALFLVPLSLWFVINVISLAVSGDAEGLNIWLSSAYCAAFFALFIALVFWHSALGVQVIIEDYVHKPFSRNFLLLLNKALHGFFAVLSLMAIFKIHYLSESVL